jgi:hypothetical protein
MTVGHHRLSRISAECPYFIGLWVIGIEPSSDENTHLVHLQAAWPSSSMPQKLTSSSSALAARLITTLT